MANNVACDCARAMVRLKLSTASMYALVISLALLGFISERNRVCGETTANKRYYHVRTYTT